MSLYRAGLWLYLSSVVGQLGGYLFWLAAAALASASALGEVAYLVSLSGIITSLLSLGLPSAVMHLYPATGDKRYAEGALAYTLALSLAAAAALAWRPVLSLLVATGSLSALYSAYLQARLDTKLIFAATAVGQAIRVALVPILIPLGADALAASYAVPGLLLIAATAGKGLRPRLWGLRELAPAGVSVWAPGVVSVLGTNLGVVAAYHLAEAEAAGLVYIAQVLANAAVAPVTIVTGALLPYLSSATDKTPRALKAARLALAISAPLAAVVIAGGGHVLALLGKQYVQAHPALAVFTVGNMISIISGVLSTLAYAEGRYSATLAGGVLANAARALLYFALGTAPLGVAASFLIGSAAHLAYFSILKRHVAASLGGLAPRLLASSLPALALSPLGLIPAAGGAVLSYLLAVRLGLVSRGELADVARQVLPDSVYAKVAPLAARVLDLVT
ncbi:MAG: hypothetical protein QXI18_03795 [Nitrososphaerota archaeon]|uniref:Polysaccharide biosynthesis protein n=1 Tax=Pyrobaculum arsenaticum TaxID=121277 RepID=A0A7L4PCH6_9CREN|nr:hypothetical protein [Pyrobaculum arsenaticum]